MGKQSNPNAKGGLAGATPVLSGLLGKGGSGDPAAQGKAAAQQAQEALQKIMQAMGSGKGIFGGGKPL
jgi:hypothetical protein